MIIIEQATKQQKKWNLKQFAFNVYTEMLLFTILNGAETIGKVNFYFAVEAF